MKNTPSRLLLVLLLLASILAIHQLIIFAGYYPLKALYPIPKVHFEAPCDLIDLDPSDKLWLLGSSEHEDAGPTARWKPALEAFPDDPAIAARVIGEMPLPSNFLENSASLAPENGWFDILIAEAHAENVFSKIRRRTSEIKKSPSSDSKSQREGRRSRRRPKFEQIEIVDSEALDKTLAALKEASGKPIIDPYIKTYLERWIASTKPAHDVATSYQDFSVWLNFPNPHSALRKPFRAFEHRMATLADAGERDEFLRLLQIMERITWRLYKSSSTTLELLIARNQIDKIAAIVTTSAEQLKLGPIAKPYQERAARFESHLARIRSDDYQTPFDEELLTQRFFSFSILSSQELRKQVTDQELKISARAEQAHLSWRFLLWCFTLISLIAIILKISLRWIKHAPYMPSRRWIAVGVLTPTLGFLIFRYLTPWGGFDKGPG